MPNRAATEPLHCVELVADAVDGPVLEELLSALELSFSSLTGTTPSAYTARIYTPSPTAARQVAARLRRELPLWTEWVQGRRPRLRRLLLQREEWAETWKRFFRTVSVSDRLVVRPSWEQYEPRPGEIVLDIDPGMCFGTGHHGTTRACLQFIDALQSHIGPTSFLDAGCGSGILMLAACRLGFQPVIGFDNDPRAVATARRNLERAGIRDCTLLCADVAAAAVPPCRVVVANILAAVLCRHAATLVRCVDVAGGDGFLILSGILTPQYPAVKTRCEQLGCREIETRTIEEWTTGWFALERAARAAAGADEVKC